MNHLYMVAIVPHRAPDPAQAVTNLVAYHDTGPERPPYRRYRTGDELVARLLEDLCGLYFPGFELPRARVWSLPSRITGRLGTLCKGLFMSGLALFVDKATDTFTDILAAVGVAEVCAAWYHTIGVPVAPILLKEQGAFYRLELPAPLDHEAVAGVAHQFVPGRGRFLLTRSIRNALPSMQGLGVYHYEEQQDLKSRYWDWLTHSGKSGSYQRQNSLPLSGATASEPPHPDPDLELYTCLNVLRATTTYNALCLQWYADSLAHFRQNLLLFLHLFTRQPNPTTEVVQHWLTLARQHQVTGPALVHRLQVVNPAAGKGSNAPKAGAVHIGNLDGFWLLEYLKFVGYFTLAVPVRLPNNDRHLYVIRPEHAELASLRTSLDTFRAVLRTTSTMKQNVLALLFFTRILLTERHQALREATSTPPASPHAIVADHPSGCPRFEVAWYKNLDSAYALKQLATLQLPHWLATSTTLAEVEQALHVVQEHIRLLTALGTPSGKESEEEIILLQLYRAFLAGHDWAPFLEFAAHFGRYALLRRKRQQWMPPLSRTGMEFVMAQTTPPPDYRTILNNPGFEAVATAIRRATISAQYWSVRDARYPYEIHYQLGQQLQNAALNTEEFLGVLTKFLKDYNAENSRIDTFIAKHQLSDEPRYRRPWLRRDHLNAFFLLLGQFSPALICNLLLAYGYAWHAHPSNPHLPAEAEDNTGASSAPLPEAAPADVAGGVIANEQGKEQPR